jgi:hypothetical protein
MVWIGPLNPLLLTNLDVNFGVVQLGTNGFQLPRGFKALDGSI